MPGDDLYSVLGVNRDASSDEIRSAYRRLARQYHPDVNPGNADAEEKFKEISSAYAVLSDGDKRAQYDQFGVTEPYQGGVNPNDFLRDFGFGDIFEAFFGGGGRTDPLNQRGGDEEVNLEITLEDVLHGTEQEVKYKRLARCGTCDSTGAKPGTEPEKCQTCNGSGSVTRLVQSFLGQMQTTTPCPTCKGKGKTIKEPCQDCKGRGLRVEDTKLSVEIPAGVENGNTLRVSGKGSDGTGNGGTGDLYVAIRVRPDKRFAREGTTLFTVKELTYAQVVLGDETEVEGLDSTVGFAIPPGTTHGHRFRLKGYGLPRLHGGSRGDLIVIAEIEIPTKLTEEQADLLRQYAVSRGEELSEPTGGGFLGGLFGKKKG
ncbi:MAG: molecular chaperone DnaJ [Fimbriimonadaceae bacterium]